MVLMRHAGVRRPELKWPVSRVWIITFWKGSKNVSVVLEAPDNAAGFGGAPYLGWIVVLISEDLDLGRMVMFAAFNGPMV